MKSLVESVLRVLTESKKFTFTSKKEVKAAALNWTEKKSVTINVNYVGYESLESRDEKSVMKWLKDGATDFGGKAVRKKFAELVATGQFTGDEVETIILRVDYQALDPDWQENTWEWEFEVVV